MSLRPKLLAILDRSPFPSDDGVHYPIAGHLKGLQNDWDIDLLLVNRPQAIQSSKIAIEESGFPFGEVLEAVPPARGRVSRFLGECLGGRPYSHHPVISEQRLRELTAGRDYDAIYSAPMLVALWADAVARVLPQRPLVVLNLNDSVSEKFRRLFDLAKISGLPPGARLRFGLRSARAMYMPRLERKMLGFFDLVCVQTPRDRDALLADCGEAIAPKLVLAPNGIKEDLLKLPYQGANEKRLVHIGGLVHNRRELLMWFVSKVYLDVRRQLPDVTLHLAGSISPEDKAYLESIPGITAHGFVENLEEVLQTSTMSVAPMFMRTGLINKNLDSMAAGVPCSGIKAFNGIAGFRNGQHGFEVSDAAQWSALLVDVLQKPELLNRVSAAGRELVKESCRWQTTLSRINDRMQSMIQS
ncbi:MAG: glycosyltransferase family 4 protein [Pirellulales bacterium]|nr:glycosyltransferase family 4 protein [Pirellulales bacterium]